jgi:hypothetical protein
MPRFFKAHLQPPNETQIVSLPLFAITKAIDPGSNWIAAHIQSKVVYKKFLDNFTQFLKIGRKKNRPTVELWKATPINIWWEPAIPTLVIIIV